MSAVKTKRRGGKMHQFIVVDPVLCTGCETCESVCSFVHDAEFNPINTRIHRVRIEPVFNIALACQKCEDAPCVRSCPRDALTQSEETGVIMVDDAKCDLCGWCLESCKHGALFLNEDKKTVMICNLCEGNPQCIEWCPENALSLMTQKEFDKKARKATVNKLIPDSWR